MSAPLTQADLAAPHANQMPWRRADLEQLRGALVTAEAQLGVAQYAANSAYSQLKQIGGLAPNDATHADAVLMVIDLWLSSISARAEAVALELAALDDPAVLRMPGEGRS